MANSVSSNVTVVVKRQILTYISDWNNNKILIDSIAKIHDVSVISVFSVFRDYILKKSNCTFSDNEKRLVQISNLIDNLERTEVVETPTVKDWYKLSEQQRQDAGK